MKVLIVSHFNTIEKIKEEIPTDSELNEKAQDESISEYIKPQDDRKRLDESVDLLERESPIKRIVHESMEYKKEEQTHSITRKTQEETNKRTQHQRKHKEDYGRNEGDGRTHLENTLYEEIRKAIPREIISNPVGTGIEAPEHFEGQMISEEYFTEAMPSTAINAKLEDSLISCLVPLQLSKPKREYLSVETM